MNSSTHTVWFNHGDLSSFQEIIRKRTASDNYNLSIRIDDSGNEILFRFYDGDGWNNVSTSAPEAGKWHFAVIWIDKKKDEVRGFLNGEMLGSASIPYYNDSSTPGNTGWSIGGYPSTGTFNGQISEYRVCDHILTLSEVRYLYSVGKKGLHVSSKKTL